MEHFEIVYYKLNRNDIRLIIVHYQIKILCYLEIKLDSVFGLYMKHS